MYSDLDKKSEGCYIIEDALVVTEVFSTAVNIRRGQIFYGRQYGYDFEKYLLRLNEMATIMDIMSDLYKIRNMDGRLICDPTQTQLYTDEDDHRQLYMKTALNVAGLPWVNAETLLEPDDDSNILTINDYIKQPDEPWETINKGEQI